MEKRGVGEKAHVKAEVEADRVTIAGKVEGKVRVTEAASKSQAEESID